MWGRPFAAFRPVPPPGYVRPEYPWPSVGADPSLAPAPEAEPWPSPAPMPHGYVPPKWGMVIRSGWLRSSPSPVGRAIAWLHAGQSIETDTKVNKWGRCWTAVFSESYGWGWMPCESVRGVPPTPQPMPAIVPGLVLDYMRRLTEQAASDPFAVDPAQVDQLAQDLTNIGRPDDAQQMSQLAARLRSAQAAHPHKIAGVGQASATFLPSSPAGLARPVSRLPFGARTVPAATPLGGRVPLPRPSALEQGGGAAAARRALALAELHRRVATHQQIVAATARQQALAAVFAQGITTPITCSVDPAMRCPIYDVVTSPATGLPDLSAPIAQVPGGATGLYADTAHPRQLSQGAALGFVTVYRVAWVDAPGGLVVFGWMPDGGFGIPPGGVLPGSYV